MTSRRDVEQPLHGRRNECEVLLRLLDRVQSGRSAVLVVRGEPGIGKSALLRFLADHAVDFRIARVAGVEIEMELPFAGLHQLCAPFLDRADRLPSPQRDALATAFGLNVGAPPDRFLVGLAVLSLLADVAADGPLVGLIDDAQWLDRVSAQVLAFVARRLFAEPIAMVFATRAGRDLDLRGLPELALTGLSFRDAGTLLDSVIPGRVEEQVRSRFIAETGGNPLALLELPRSLDAADLAGQFAVGDQHPVAERIEARFARRIRDLPSPTRQLLLVAAVEPLGDVVLLWRAADVLGIDRAAAAPAEAADLLSLGTSVHFRHPLLRSAIHRCATTEERRRAHHALARMIDADLDPDRRAWHRAQASAGPDEQVAAELQASATRARQRGGAAAEAAFLEQAVVLTPDSRQKAGRALAAAQAKLRAGSPADTLELLAVAEQGPLSDLDVARASLLRAQIQFAADRGQGAAPHLLSAARRLEELDPRLARETYLEAISAAMFAGRLARAADVTEVARSARAAPSVEGLPGVGDQLLDGLALLFTEGYRVATPSGKAMLRTLRTTQVKADDLRYLWLAAAAAADMWEDDTWRALTIDHVRIARDTGVLAELPLALNSRIMVHLFCGEFGAAGSLVAELASVTESTGTDLASYGAMGLVAWQGDEAIAGPLIEKGLADVVSRGEGIGVTSAPTCSTVNGCEPWIDDWTRAVSCVPPTTCSSRSAQPLSPSGPDSRCTPPARLCHDARPTAPQI